MTGFPPKSNSLFHNTFTVWERIFSAQRVLTQQLKVFFLINLILRRQDAVSSKAPNTEKKCQAFCKFFFGHLYFNNTLNRLK